MWQISTFQNSEQKLDKDTTNTSQQSNHTLMLFGCEMSDKLVVLFLQDWLLFIGYMYNKAEKCYLPTATSM